MEYCINLGCHDMWTVFNESVQKTAMHSFMVLARDASTTVLKIFLNHYYSNLFGAFFRRYFKLELRSMKLTTLDFVVLKQRFMSETLATIDTLYKC